MIMHVFHVSEREITPANAGLVGNEKKQKTASGQLRQSVHRPRDKDYVQRAMEVMPLFDDGAVTIQEHCAFHVCPPSPRRRKNMAPGWKGFTRLIQNRLATKTFLNGPAQGSAA
jgi:hypothetical protein